jgi:hypothetical protein
MKARIKKILQEEIKDKLKQRIEDEYVGKVYQSKTKTFKINSVWYQKDAVIFNFTYTYTHLDYNMWEYAYFIKFEISNELKEYYNIDGVYFEGEEIDYANKKKHKYTIHKVT